MIVLLQIISWNGVSRFNEGFVFQMGGFIFKCWEGEGVPMGGISFGGRGGSKKIVRWGLPPMLPLWENLKRIIS